MTANAWISEDFQQFSMSSGVSPLSIKPLLAPPRDLDKVSLVSATLDGSAFFGTEDWRWSTMTAKEWNSTTHQSSMTPRAREGNDLLDDLGEFQPEPEADDEILSVELQPRRRLRPSPPAAVSCFKRIPKILHQSAASQTGEMLLSTGRRKHRGSHDVLLNLEVSQPLASSHADGTLWS